MKQARLTREARAEFLAQTAYYETLRNGLGSRFRAQIEQAAQFHAIAGTHQLPEYWLGRIPRNDG